MEIGPATAYDASRRAHVGEIDVGLGKLAVAVIGPPDLSAETRARRVDRGVDFVTGKFSVLLDFLCGVLLPVKNSGWLREGEAPLSPEAFKRSFTPRRLTLFEDGALEIGFRDRGLFWGHEVVLRTDPELRPNEADIEG